MFFRKTSKRKKSADDGGDELLNKMNGKLLRYAVRRTSSGEEVIGREGRIVVTDTEIALRFDAKDAFLCLRDGSLCGELMNLEGVRIDGLLPDGRREIAIAYYKSYRK